MCISDTFKNFISILNLNKIFMKKTETFVNNFNKYIKFYRKISEAPKVLLTSFETDLVVYVHGFVFYGREDIVSDWRDTLPSSLLGLLQIGPPILHFRMRMMQFPNIGYLT